MQPPTTREVESHKFRRYFADDPVKGANYSLPTSHCPPLDEEYTVYLKSYGGVSYHLRHIPGQGGLQVVVGCLVWGCSRRRRQLRGVHGHCRPTVDDMAVSVNCGLFGSFEGFGVDTRQAESRSLRKLHGCFHKLAQNAGCSCGLTDSSGTFV